MYVDTFSFRIEKLQFQLNFAINLIWLYLFKKTWKIYYIKNTTLTVSMYKRYLQKETERFQGK